MLWMETEYITSTAWKQDLPRSKVYTSLSHPPEASVQYCTLDNCEKLAAKNSLFVISLQSLSPDVVLLMCWVRLLEELYELGNLYALFYSMLYVLRVKSLTLLMPVGSCWPFYPVMRSPMKTQRGASVIWYVSGTLRWVGEWWVLSINSSILARTPPRGKENEEIIISSPWKVFNGKSSYCDLPSPEYIFITVLQYIVLRRLQPSEMSGVASGVTAEASTPMIWRSDLLTPSPNNGPPVRLDLFSSWVVGRYSNQIDRISSYLIQ